ncbi:hypothetical protein EDB83DRAFT_2324966 [Lactarius deliciosus]|nr:hypothetical protein EDB83DRAFT_2324966 [Lactarius deliciosus]
MQLRWQQGDSKLGVASAPSPDTGGGCPLDYLALLSRFHQLLVVSPLLSSSPAPLARLAPALTHHCLYGNTSITRLLDGELDAASALSWQVLQASHADWTCVKPWLDLELRPSPALTRVQLLSRRAAGEPRHSRRIIEQSQSYNKFDNGLINMIMIR